MENNKAIVCIIENIQPIEGADKIVQADVMLDDIKLTQVVVGVGQFQEKDLIVYFDSNLCFDEQIILDNPEIATYLGKHNRVRTIKLRGVMSNGLALPLEKFYKYLKVTDKTLIPGYSFEEIHGQRICFKYFPPQKGAALTVGKDKKGKALRKVSRMLEKYFRFHIDTAHLLRNVHRLDPHQIISISKKIHGSSFIVAHCLVKKKLSFKETIFQKLGIPVIDTEYDYIYSSRKVIKNAFVEDKIHFYGENIWETIGKEYFLGKLMKGETVYGEVGGYVSGGGMIQKGYDYGCKPGQHRIFVYRITMTDVDGNVIEYGWQQMKARCKQLNVEMVPELYYGKAKDLFDINIGQHWLKNFITLLKATYLEKDCDMCFPKIADEGIVYRMEGWDIEAYKLKSERFTLLENTRLEEGVEDIENNESMEQ